jgi:hypothetical protein
MRENDSSRNDGGGKNSVIYMGLISGPNKAEIHAGKRWNEVQLYSIYYKHSCQRSYLFLRLHACVPVRTEEFSLGGGGLGYRIRIARENVLDIFKRTLLANRHVILALMAAILP